MTDARADTVPRAGGASSQRAAPVSAAALLRLPGAVLAHHLTDDRLTLTVALDACHRRVPDHPLCQACRRNGRTASGGWADFPLLGRPVELHFDRQRFAGPCPGDSRPTALPADFSLSWRARLELLEWLAEACLAGPVEKVGATVIMPRRKLQRLFRLVVEKLSARAPVVLGGVLGLDDVHAPRAVHATLVDLERPALIDLGASCRSADLRVWLGRLAPADSVRIVVIDPARKLRTAVRAVFPAAVVIADRFHVERLVRKALLAYRRALKKRLPVRLERQGGGRRGDTISRLLTKRRKRLRCGEGGMLEQVLAAEPLLRQAYDAGQAFLAIYELTDAAEAARRLDAWAASVPLSLERYFRKALLTIASWRSEILAFFSHGRWTTGRVESYNRVVKGILAEGRGHMPHPVLRLKALYRLGGLDPALVREVAREVALTEQPYRTAREIAG